MDREVLVWDTERQIFNGIGSNELLEKLMTQTSIDCILFLAWLPNIKSVFLHKSKRLDIIFADGTTYNLKKVPALYDVLFSLRHGVN